jgi:hypothetical protein
MSVPLEENDDGEFDEGDLYIYGRRHGLDAGAEPAFVHTSTNLFPWL